MSIYKTKVGRAVVFSLCLMTLVSCIAKTGTRNDIRPNIIVVLSDDAGYADFSSYGGRQIPTPNIDAIAAAGVRFTNAYVSASVCAPSRAGLLTGRYQQRFGFEHNTSREPASGYTHSDMGMDPAEKTIGDELKSNGYRTLAIGKWHQGSEEKHFPLNRGFDQFYGFIGGQRSFFTYKKTPPREQQLYSNRHIVPEDSITYLTDMWTDKAISFIKNKDEKPFFIYLAYNAVHTPKDARRELWEKFPDISDRGRRTYAAIMTSLDLNVGRLTQALREGGLEENTLVFFVNDNGGATNNSSDNGLLRGMKGSKWEGGIRVPMMMKWPKKVPGNSTYTHPVSTLDILPTSIAASNGRRKGSKILDGVNLLPYIMKQNKSVPHQTLFWRRGGAAAVREGNWKLIRVTSNPVLLFNLEKDQSETTNLASQNPEIVKQLLQRLSEWEKELSTPHWGSTSADENQILKHRMGVIGRDMERMYP